MIAQGDPRHIAWEVLHAVDDRAAYANLMLPSLLRERRLEARDAGFATELTYTTLRWRGFIDAVIEACAQRQTTLIDTNSLNALRLGVAQILLLRVPAHAAVSTTVDLAAAVASPNSRGFVNAVLRRASELDLLGWQSRIVEKTTDELTSLSLRYSHPRWIVVALRDALQQCGRSIAELPVVLQANNDAVRPTLVARPPHLLADTLAQDVSGSLGRWVDTAVEGVRGDIGAISAIRKGYAGVQDEGSQLIAHVLAGISISGDDSQWLDMCAGPGGKAALLAGLAEARMAHLTALDLQEHRVNLLRDALRHFPRADVHTCDATDLTQLPDYRDGMFDRVLVDAPCSGIGALRRRPDLRWQRDASAVSGLASLQEALLLAAVKAVRVGGVVGYATCSPHVSETAVVVKQVRRLARQQGIETEIVNVSDQLSQVPHVRNGSELATLNGGKPFLQLWPDVHGTDAMFLAILRRVETAHD